MKKLVLVAACLGFMASPVFAQKKQVKNAINLLNDKKVEEAKTAIEAAVTDESTKNDPQAWFVRGTVYLALQQDAAEGKTYYKEALKSYQRVLELKADYEKEDMNNKLFAIAIYNFNDGIAAFQGNKHDAAFENFGSVVTIHDLEGGKRFATNTGFDTMSRQATLYQGFSAYNSKNYDAAIPLLEKAKKDPITISSNYYNVYLMLGEIYEMKKDEAKTLATFAEGKKTFPGEKAIVNAELNYYIKNGRSEELITKLEDALKGEPTNSDMLYLLGTAYDQMANPKNNGTPMPRPANYSEVATKAENAYKAAIAAKADNADAIYNLGALYFNRAVAVNDDMNTVVEKSNDPANKKNAAALDKKYEELKAERNAWFAKALPNLEKTISTYDAKSTSLTGADKDAYFVAMSSARTIYASMGGDASMKAKSDALKTKLDALK